jgi:hypothetical protein
MEVKRMFFTIILLSFFTGVGLASLYPPSVVAGDTNPCPGPLCSTWVECWDVAPNCSAQGYEAYVQVGYNGPNYTCVNFCVVDTLGCGCW